MVPYRAAHISSVLDAVETLSSIMELDTESKSIGLCRRKSIEVIGHEFSYRHVVWIEQKNASEVIEILKDTYTVVLRYLRSLYQEDKPLEEDSVRGIERIMKLLGEASRKLGRCTTIFHGVHRGLVERLFEYKELKKFYVDKVFKLTGKGISWQRLMEISESSTMKTPIKISPILNREDIEGAILDLESLKQDKSYELLFLRKEDGRRFFDPELVKNVKMVCEFGQHFEGYEGDDPLTRVKMWQEKTIQITARFILDTLKSPIQDFYMNYSQYRDMELAKHLNNMMMALMLSANSANLLSKGPAKCSYQYFSDFKGFLTKVLQSNEYRRLIAAPPNPSDSFLRNLLGVIHGVCRGLFTHVQGLQELVGITLHLLEKERKEVTTHAKAVVQNFDELLESSDHMIENILKKHPNGPLFKVLDLFMGGAQTVGFDLFTQQNYPYKLYEVFIQDQSVSVLYLPSPTSQSSVHQASVLGEFSGFLRSYGSDVIPQKHVLFNLQDRTSWQEHARCRALETLQLQAEHSKNITVVTLNKDGEFYHQLAPYHALRESQAFMQQFQEHLQDESAGFYFPKKLKEALFSSFIRSLMHKIHKVFFKGTQNLSRGERLNFIELTYLFIQLKVIDIESPTSMSFTCKDGVDIGASANVEFMAFIKFLHGQSLTSEEKDLVLAMLFTPALFVRERNIREEAFQRLESVIQFLESLNIKHEDTSLLRDTIYSEFKSLFKNPLLESKLRIPKVKKSASI